MKYLSVIKNQGITALKALGHLTFKKTLWSFQDLPHFCT